jgi:hemolysin D
VSLPFAETLRALDADRRSGLPALLPALVLLALWVAWALLARLPILAESTAATVEPQQPPIVLAAPADGLVAPSSALLSLGQDVLAGQALLRLDASDLNARLAALRARRRALLAEIAALAAQQTTARQALDQHDRGATATAGELAANARQSQTAALLADQIHARTQRLADAGLLSASDAARAQADADEHRQAATGATLAFAARAHQARAEHADRRASLDRLDGEAARLDQALAALDGDAATLAAEIALRTLRAPASGHLADLAPALPGSRVTRGTRLATLVPPSGSLRILALFPPTSATALRPAQRAWVHLAAGLASPAALLPATVATVAAVAVSPHAGAGYRAVLALSTGAAARWPQLRAGQPCRVEVEVGRQTPAALLFAALRQATAPRLP